MIRIREATNLDSGDIRKVHMRAFPETENEKVATLAVHLLEQETDPETLSLVAEVDGDVVGHIAFSPVTIDHNNSWTGYILAPLGVKPEYQRRKIGSKLIETGMERLSKMGVNVIFVYGDPDYYSKYGFNPDAASRYSPPYELQYPFGWQAVILNENVVGDSPVIISCARPLCDPALW